MRILCIRYRNVVLIPILLCPSLALSRNNGARQVAPSEFVCGTNPQRDRDALARARYHESRTKLMERLGRHPLTQAGAASSTADVGDVAVIEDDGTVITEINRFDLAGKSIRFEPTGSGSYRAVASISTYDSTAGISLTLKDDDSVAVQLGFSFPFYGSAYARVELNSDGNLTFGRSDVATSARDLGRFLDGPPRIAPFFADLNPESGGTISYHSASDGIVFTWNAVPDFDSSANRNSFNVKLFTNGSIEFTYGPILSTSAIVGIAPGNSVGGVNAVDFSGGLPTSNLTGALAEVFSNSNAISEAALSRLFFRTHPDEFDSLVVFLGYNYSIPGAYAYELNIKNEIEGIGYEQVDYAQDYGSQGRLRSFVLMGSLNGGNYPYPSDPTVKAFRTYNTLELIAHEVAHRWLAYPRVLNGTASTFDLLRSDKGHWSFFLNANASLMEGNTIDDRGVTKGNARFMTVDVTNRYSELDLYLMGYGRQEDVPPAFFVESPSGTFNTVDTLPYLGATFGGTRKDFTIEDVIGANGPRIPSVLQSPKVYRQAFILLVQRGQQVPLDQVAKLQKIRDQFVPYFNRLTGGTGYSVTNPQSAAGTTPVQIYYPYFQGNSNRYTGIAVANWGSTPADVLFQAFDNSGNVLSTPSSIVNPRMITIPPGGQIAMLGEQIHGLSLDDPRNGWIRAQSSSSQVSGFFLDGNVGPTFLDGAVAGNQAYTNFYFTQTQMGTSATPGSTFTNLIDIVNPSTTAASLILTLTDGTNTARASTTRTLNPHGRLAEDLSSLFPGITKPRTDGYVIVTSSAPVIGYQAIDTGTTVYALPAQQAATAATLYSAQFASGTSGTTRYFTDLNLINTSGQARSLQVRLVDNNGLPVQVSGIKNPTTVDLLAGQQLRVRGEELFNLPAPAAATSLVEGSLVITGASGIIGDVTFGDAFAQKFIASLPLDGVPVSTFVFSQVAQGAAAGAKPYFTGIALYNPNSTAVNVAIDVYAEQGTKTGSATIPLNAGARISKTLPELVPAVTEQARGYIRITSSGGPISAFELFGSQSLDFLTAVPPQPINP